VHRLPSVLLDGADQARQFRAGFARGAEPGMVRLSGVWLVKISKRDNPGVCDLQRRATTGE
jgi:hypothetical protein